MTVLPSQWLLDGFPASLVCRCTLVLPSALPAKVSFSLATLRWPVNYTGLAFVPLMFSGYLGSFYFVRPSTCLGVPLRLLWRWSWAFPFADALEAHSTTHWVFDRLDGSFLHSLFLPQPLNFYGWRRDLHCPFWYPMLLAVHH